MHPVLIYAAAWGLTALVQQLELYPCSVVRWVADPRVADPRMSSALRGRRGPSPFSLSCSSLCCPAGGPHAARWWTSCGATDGGAFCGACGAALVSWITYSIWRIFTLTLWFVGGVDAGDGAEAAGPPARDRRDHPAVLEMGNF